jgi:nucleotide-binding universal stress UspA family protein
MKILLAVDDSKFSEAATEAVIRQARPQDTTVRVLNVEEQPAHLTAGGMAGYDPALDNELKDEVSEAEQLVSRTADLLRSKGFEVTASAEMGDPKYKIIDVAEEWGADLIVLGSHGRSGLSRFLMGSVSEAVARHAHCSVTIVRVPVAKSSAKAENVTLLQGPD